ncbi:MAG: uroporphyrinogen-III synthase [Kiloniellales bacterium]
MRLLITRTPDDAATLVAALEARGHDCLVEPLYSVVPAEIDEATLAEALAEAPGGVQALLFTSANGARAFAARSARRDLPVYAVGDATAAAARAAGFTQVESAGGDVQALAALVAGRLEPAQGALFHAAARQVAGDLQGQLTAKGFEVRRLVLYEARPVERLSASAEAALGAGTLDAALFFSPRSAETFVRLLSDAGLQGSGARVHVLALSAAVAEALAPITWAGTTIAARPDTAALLEALDGLGDEITAKEQPVDDKPSDSQRGGAPSGSGEADSAITQTPAADGSAETPALAVIAAFGGIRPMAAKLGIAVSTVQGWRERTVIPQPRHEDIMTAARSHGVDLDPALLAASDHPPVTAAAGRSALPQSGARAPSDAKPGDGTTSEKSDRAGKPEQARETATVTAPLAAAEAKSARAQVSRRGGAGWAFFLLGAVVFGAGAAAAVVTRPQWQPLLAELTGEPAAGSAEITAVPPELAQRLAALEAKLGEVEAEQARIAAQPVPAGRDAAAVENLTSSLDALSARFDVLEKETQAALSSGQTAGVSAEELTPLRSAIEQLAARVDTVEGQAQGDAAGAAELADLSEEMTSLESRLAQAEGRLASVEDGGRSLQASVDELIETNQAARASAGGSAALALAVAQLRYALRSGAPYSAELEQLRGLSHDDPKLAALLDPLAPRAASGAPTLEALQRSFPPVAREAVAAGQGDEAEGWLGGVLRRVSGVVTVRPVGEVEGDTAGAIIARAEARLQDGNLAATISELDSLQGHAAEAARDWRSQAQARVAAERALSQLAAHAIARLGPDGE